VTAAAPARISPHAASREHVLPVVFDGDDLAAVAAAVGASTEHVVALLVGAELEVAFVGFAPGFPYLTGLPPELAALPAGRRPGRRCRRGRWRWPPGSPPSIRAPRRVAGTCSAGRPRPSSTRGAPHSRVAPGDRVRFVVADRGGGDGDEPAAVPRSTAAPGRRAMLEVLEPGLATTVQDGGRRGTARLGVPVGGTADRRSAALVNLLLGNGRDAAVLECTAVGPALRMAGDGHLAVVGTGRVEVSVDGHPAPTVPSCGGRRPGGADRPVDGGLRAYLGVAGGSPRRASSGPAPPTC